MGKELGSGRLGELYNGKKARKRREWRGFKDTWYAYTQWLKIWKVLIKFMAKPRNIKGFFPLSLDAELSGGTRFL